MMPIPPLSGTNLTNWDVENDASFNAGVFVVSIPGINFIAACGIFYLVGVATGVGA